MSTGYLLRRTKTDAVADPNPNTTPAFVPPEGEVFKPASKGVRGFFAYLRFTTPGMNTATVRIYTRDSARTPQTWQEHGLLALRQDGIVFLQDDTLSHDVWIGFEAITGGNPI